MSQLSPPPVFSYPNQRVVRPPLSRAHRTRAFVAGAVSNTLLTAGLTIVSLAGILFLIVAIMWFIGEVSRRSTGEEYSRVDTSLGLSSEHGWVVWVVLIGAVILGLIVIAAAIWIGKAMLASAGVARSWAVTWSASGILVGLGLLMSTVISPVAGPLVAIVVGAVLGSGLVSGENASQVGVVFAISIIATVIGFVVYAAAGSLVWWWMAHALRRAA